MDLNLLRVLDALLQESSVAAAAERLGTTSPAVSRSLARLRRLTGDPLLVRAGQGLVPTARATEIRDEVHSLVGHADTILRPGSDLDPRTIERSFTVQVAELFLIGLAVPLLAGLQSESPGVSVTFVPEAMEGTGALRRGDVDIELGVLSNLEPEVCRMPLTTIRLCGVARQGHPLFDGPIDAQRYAACSHIGTSRRGKKRGPIDDALADLGLQRRVVVVVPDHTSAMLLARSTDLIALTAPEGVTTDTAPAGLRSFAIPLELPGLDVGLAWHPRNDRDPAHRWFRRRVATAFGEAARG